MGWFDGDDWHPFFVPGTFIYDAILDFGVDRTGKLYIGHENGISTLVGYLWGDGYKSARSICFDKDNRLWFGTSGWGIGVYDRQNWTMYNKNDGLLENFTYTAIDSNYNIWVSYFHKQKAVSRFNRRNWEHFTHENGLLDEEVGPIYIDKDGLIWFAHIFSKALSVYRDTTTTEIKIPAKLDKVPNNFILYPNFPNPFNSETTIHYELKQDVNIHYQFLI